MINKIGVEDITGRKNSTLARQKQEGIQTNPSFKGAGALILAGFQKCEQSPMINVAVIDMLSAILPRTIVESMTNMFAGFEAFRRESSGLIVNCLIPSFITLGIAKILNPMFMPKGVNMSHSWSDRDLIQKTAEIYDNTTAKDKVEESIKTLITGTQGIDGDKSVKFNTALSKEEIENYSKKLAQISRKKIKNYEMRKEVGKISKEIVSKTHVSENIKVDKLDVSSVDNMLKDTVKFFREFEKADGKVSMAEFAKKNKNLVRTKSILGLAVVLPLAASMQYINRWITGKISGTKGAPIYDDFGKGQNIEEKPEAKKGLLRQKLISISSMLGVSLLSLTKMPTWKMLDFKGMFPTMDQARIISTTTFASRMAAADDKNELAEATVRDIATFSSLYYLGDVAAKGAATIIQKKTGVTLLNDMKTLEKGAGAWKKFKHWMKDVNVKSSSEVIGKKAINYRSACQATNLGVSLALLGLVIPIFTRRNTKRKHEQALKLAQENKTAQTENKKQEPAVTPLNVEYTKLTAGFRADNKKTA